MYTYKPSAAILILLRPCYLTRKKQQKIEILFLKGGLIYFQIEKPAVKTLKLCRLSEKMHKK